LQRYNKKGKSEEGKVKNLLPPSDFGGKVWGNGKEILGTRA
jgi:hypothetical protein